MDRFDLSSGIMERHPLEEGPLASNQKAGERHGKAADLERLKNACKDFESIFVYTLLKTMRRSLPKREEPAMGSAMYTSMGDLELARSLAHGRGLGLGDLLFEQLKGKVP